MNADRCIRRARSARDEHDAGTPGQLAISFGHVGRATFLPAHDEAQSLARVVQRVEHGKKTLAGDTEGKLDALTNEVIDKDLATVAHG